MDMKTSDKTPNSGGQVDAGVICLPCPFCGHRAELESGELAGKKYWVAGCKTDSCPGDRSVKFGAENMMDVLFAWNGRVPRQAGLLLSAKIAADWMRGWLEQDICDCGEHCFCGKPDRWKELLEIEAAIAAAVDR